MKISGAAIIRNGVKLKFPFMESIKSILPICSEFIVAVGQGEDNTKEMIEAIKDPKIKIIDTVWDQQKRTGGTILSEQTNAALSKCGGDWIFYLQSDEVVHEQDHSKILESLKAISTRNDVDGLAFDYMHFYGSYHTVQSGKNWYPQEVRIIRNNSSILSHGDAQGFRKNGEKIRAVLSGAKVYHYGWARPPEVMAEKINSFHRLWHDDKWVEENAKGKALPDYYTDLGNLIDFTGTHPGVMSIDSNTQAKDFITACKELYLKNRSIRPFISDAVKRTWIGQHRNFKLIK